MTRAGGGGSHGGAGGGGGARGGGSSRKRHGSSRSGSGRPRASRGSKTSASPRPPVAGRGELTPFRWRATCCCARAEAAARCRPPRPSARRRCGGWRRRRRRAGASRSTRACRARRRLPFAANPSRRQAKLDSRSATSDVDLHAARPRALLAGADALAISRPVVPRPRWRAHPLMQEGEGETRRRREGWRLPGACSRRSSMLGCRRRGARRWRRRRLQNPGFP